jgi:hypothetical protein
MKTLKQWAEETIDIIALDIKKYSDNSKGNLGKSLNYKIKDYEVSFFADDYFHSANEANKYKYTKRAFSDKRMKEYETIQSNEILKILNN